MLKRNELNEEGTARLRKVLKMKTISYFRAMGCGAGRGGALTSYVVIT
jgi:hypothetical protein